LDASLLISGLQSSAQADFAFLDQDHDQEGDNPRNDQITVQDGDVSLEADLGTGESGDSENSDNVEWGKTAAKAAPDLFRQDSQILAPTSNVAEPEPRLIIAIDFGTEFTGVAYYHADPRGALRDARQLVKEKIRVVHDWPGRSSGSHVFPEKTPSIIAYNTDAPIWGLQVTENDQPFASYFKLDLEPAAGRVGIELGQRNRRQHQLPDRDSMDIITDYLTCVYTYIRDVHFRALYGQTYLQNQHISIVMTVPALWTAFGQDLARTVAKVGISGDTLSLVTEPEAAALYCISICEDVDVESGDRFVMCDAGGGTVV
jgi:molecular chaperone DnaK (HSP70)